MKKTLTVNLGGTVFHIDEDAYQLLEKYLSNLRVHFKKEEGSDEIMNDFEMRISELLGERIKLGFEVITIEHVEEVIKRMGKRRRFLILKETRNLHRKREKLILRLQVESVFTATRMIRYWVVLPVVLLPTWIGIPALYVSVCLFSAFSGGL